MANDAQKMTPTDRQRLVDEYEDAIAHGKHLTDEHKAQIVAACAEAKAEAFAKGERMVWPLRERVGYDRELSDEDKRIFNGYWRHTNWFRVSERLVTGNHEAGMDRPESVESVLGKFIAEQERRYPKD